MEKTVRTYRSTCNVQRASLVLAQYGGKRGDFFSCVRGRGRYIPTDIRGGKRTRSPSHLLETLTYV